jgi:hypothetical protein
MTGTAEIKHLLQRGWPEDGAWPRWAAGKSLLAKVGSKGLLVRLPLQPACFVALDALGPSP